MRPKIKPIRDLFFRFIQGSNAEGQLDAQTLALLMHNDELIYLIPNKIAPSITHYQDREVMSTVVGSQKVANIIARYL